VPYYTELLILHFILCNSISNYSKIGKRILQENRELYIHGTVHRELNLTSTQPKLCIYI